MTDMIIKRLLIYILGCVYESQMVMENWSRDRTILCKKNWRSGIGRKKLGAIGENGMGGYGYQREGVRL